MQTTDTQLVTSIRVEKRKRVVNKNFIDVVKDNSKFRKIKVVTADKGYKRLTKLISLLI